MPDATVIITQPADDGANVTDPRAAYKPFEFKVRNETTITGNIKAAYCICNVFINGTPFITVANSAPYEILPVRISLNVYYNQYSYYFNLSSILQTFGLKAYRFKVYCTFQLAVIQADGTVTDPTYTSSPSFVYNILNMTMQNGDGHLVVPYLTKYMISPGTLLPLTRRPARTFIGVDQVDSFPYFQLALPPYTPSITINYKLIGNNTVNTLTASYTQNDIYVPFGTTDLKVLFPTIDFTTVSEYYLTTADGLVTTTQVIEHCDDKDVRVYFTNYLGTIDSINLKVEGVEHISKSDKYLAISSDLPEGENHRIGRMDVASNNTYTVSTNKYDEVAMSWIQELVDSPKAWIQGDGFRIPIVIQDGSLIVKKGTERFRYDVSMKFDLSNEFITVRN